MSTRQSRLSSSLRAESVGCLAYQAIGKAPDANVIGSTSRGIFLLTPGKRVIFISYQAQRSPLTITLKNRIEKLERLQAGMTASLSLESIRISDAGIEVDLVDASVWTPPDPAGNPGNRDECRQRLKQTIQCVVLANGDLGFGPLLLPLTDPRWAGALTEELTPVLAKISLLEHALVAGNAKDTLPILQRLLGLGRGLTPSGDDFIMGLLLAANRWPHLFTPQPGLEALNHLLVEKAYSLTTSISANLIESATLGYGDERLLSSLDGIVTGSLSADECAANLLNLGASSGIDALVGITSMMACAI